eukprot:TRINITY_DN2597_c0_g1_i3.p1 TRINITY_DN2597_c0_g1~~TRINITY_DN2597_c0_g1_i3.p1  ORF type:complete len:348 (+),score=67.59 TRINITY_DN2597_c0_g1_i3:145-1044(+)
MDVILGDAQEYMPREQILDHIATCHAVIAWSHDRIDREMIDAAPLLRLIANFGAGYDTVDVEYATQKGIIVTNTPGVLSDATADLTFALILNATRRMYEAEQFLRAGRWPTEGSPTLFNGMSLQGKVLGIVGMGQIGKAVARRANAFGMRVVYHNRSRVHADIETELDAKYCEFEELLKNSDVVSLLCPLTEATTHLIGKKQLGLMKGSSYLINTARGKVVDESALIEALEQGRIAGAGMDVFHDEPQCPARLTALSNVTLVPHIGSATLETRTAMHELAAKNVRAVLNGREAITPVNS